MQNKSKINVKHVIKNMISRLNEQKTSKKSLREQLVTAAAGFVALVSAAGGMAALQMKMENPEYKEKHPKLAAFLDILGELGAEASKARTREQEEGGDNTIDDEELTKIEDELEGMFDIKGDCPVPGAKEPEAEPINESRLRSKTIKRKTFPSALLLNEVKNKLRKPRKR